MLRDEEGTVHVFPNGSINTLANKSKDFSYYVIDARDPVSRGRRPRHGDPARSRRRAAGGIPHFGAFILEPIEMLGVDAFARLVDADEDADQDRAAEAV